MYIPFFIAKRYFTSRSSENLVYRMGVIAFLSVMLSTTALLLALSIFNGLEGVIRDLFQTFDPAIKISLIQGKHFVITDDLIEKIEEIPGVAKVVETLEDNVLLAYNGRQTVAKLKGVSENFLYDNPLEKHLMMGDFQLQKEGIPLALVGAGIGYMLSLKLYNVFQELQVYYPYEKLSQSIGKVPRYSKQFIRPIGIFSVERDFDHNYVIVPISFAKKIFHIENQLTALEIQLKQGVNVAKIKNQIQKIIPVFLKVLDADEQQRTLFQILHIERLLLLTTFFLIVIIASLNLFFILSMLVIAKKADIAILYILGMRSQHIKTLFLLEGIFIGILGVFWGMLLALLLIWLQQTFGFIKLGMQAALTKAYPVKFLWSDLIITIIGVFIATILASYRPAVLATKTNIKAYI